MTKSLVQSFAEMFLPRAIQVPAEPSLRSQVRGSEGVRRRLSNPDREEGGGFRRWTSVVPGLPETEEDVEGMVITQKG